MNHNDDRRNCLQRCNNDARDATVDPHHIVGYVDEDGEFRDDVPMLLHTWKQLNHRPENLEKAGLEVERIQFKVSTLGLTVPCTMLAEIAKHIVNDVGNVIVRFDAEGNREVLSKVLRHPRLGYAFANKQMGIATNES